MFLFLSAALYLPLSVFNEFTVIISNTLNIVHVPRFFVKALLAIRCPCLLIKPAHELFSPGVAYQTFRTNHTASSQSTLYIILTTITSSIHIFLKGFT